ncbi:MAG: ABC transporter ATP-binding protein [Bacteroidales bacterium]|jgi:ABC-2 type transport system ATP-binding protein|nr:ABC transporter ATP-binding protein [Bacteroidales bacterium]
MITLQNIRFGYSKKKILFEELSLHLSPGHIYGLLGKNGVGKTTLLKIISGLSFPQSGTPMLFGKRAEFRYPDVLQRISFLTEELYCPHLTIDRLEKTFAVFYPKFSHEQFQNYLQEFEIESSTDFLDKLSHGQQKKVWVSFYLATNTEILLMDEPTNGMDIPSKSIFRRVLASAASEERLFLISTHQVRDLHSLIDAVIVLDRGEIILNEPNERITEKLTFRSLREDEPNPQAILYKEEGIRGTYLIEENQTGEETPLDLELLFNALMINKQAIIQIFNPKN